MVIDLAEDPDKSTSGPAKLTEEVMGIMCRWVQASESDYLQKVGRLGINLIWSGRFGEGLQMGATFKVRPTRFAVSLRERSWKTSCGQLLRKPQKGWKFSDAQFRILGKSL